MKHVIKSLMVAVVIAVAGCGAPKPPGWPAGEERPINPSHVTKAPK